MLFQVSIELHIPHDLDPQTLTALREAERDRAHALQRAGTVRHIWRVVGRVASVGIWEADSHEELHEAISSLPLFPYFSVTVTPLARHPNALH